MKVVVLSLMHYSLNINPSKIGLCRETWLFKNQYVFNKESRSRLCRGASSSFIKGKLRASPRLAPVPLTPVSATQ